jgi:hypothetical protein
MRPDLQSCKASHLFESPGRSPTAVVVCGPCWLAARRQLASLIPSLRTRLPVCNFLFTWLKTQGIDDALIQPYSGHASRQSLEVYSRIAIADAQERATTGSSRASLCSWPLSTLNRPGSGRHSIAWKGWRRNAHREQPLTEEGLSVVGWANGTATVLTGRCSSRAQGQATSRRCRYGCPQPCTFRR